ncbi:AAA domain-containing protein [Plectosphaerella plurivora]|uniref:DNA repair protein RAD50 n=1 Tax=Plectosphaerella plurivora TaxID=936078 RepID=A0A9P8VJY1_9PEZI|nr:AAA domain-containing protein [Plectosphaerella plurivora]
MSKIDKLSIQGIRSFGANQGRETMQFYTPLTLIVGYNGSGKTTIIECLKYATTGLQPPNSTGGAFIHDPKLIGEREVLGQVKLAFTGTTGIKYIVSRSLQLTVTKANKRTTKTLDCTLQHSNSGEKSSITSRVADMDTLVPQCLGVSTAILEYVIFCHQDESLWPMSEPASLKKKFDEIFEAMRYTKAITNLKQLRKKHGDDLGKLKLAETHEKAINEKANEAKDRMSELEASIEEARVRCKDMTEEMDLYLEQAKAKRLEANSFLAIANELTSKTQRLGYRQETLSDLRTNLEELPDDDAHLEDALAQYEQRMDRFASEEAAAREQFGQLQIELARLRKEHANKLAEQGKHESDKNKYERQLATRVELIRDAAVLHGFRGYENDINDKEVKSFNERIQKLLTEKKRDLERVQKDNARELDAATTVITDFEARKATLTQNRVFAKQRIGAIDKRTLTLQNNIESLDVDEGAKAVLDSQFGDVDARLGRTTSQLESAGFDGQLAEENEKLWQLEAEGEKLGRELLECTRMASERAQLDFRKKELADRKRKVDALTSTWKPKLDAHLDQAWEGPEELDAVYQASVKNQSTKVVDVRQKRDAVRQKHQKIDYRVKTARDTVQKKTDEATRCQNAVVKALQTVRSGTTIDDYEDEYKLLEDDVETLTTDISLLDALADYYEKCQETLDKKNKCRLCERSFDDKQAVAKSRFSDRLTKFLDPDKKQKATEDLTSAQATLSKLQTVKPDFESYKRLAAELPSLTDECKTLEAELEALSRQLEEHDEDVGSQEDRQKNIESLNKTVMSITQGIRDIKESESQVDRIQSQQSSGMTTRAAEEIHELQATCNEAMRAAKAKVAKLTADRQRLRDQLNGLELEKSELRIKLSKVQSQLERKKDFEGQIRTLKEEQTNQREAVQTADRDLEVVEPEIAEARSAREETLRRGRGREQAIVDERDKVANSMTEIRMVDVDIRDYIEQGGQENLASNQRAVASLEKTMTSTDSNMSKLTARMSQLQQDMDNGDRKRQNISNNLKYRETLREMQVLRREVAELESRNASEDYERLEEDAKQLDNRYNRTMAERGSVMGEMRTKDEELQRLIETYEREYADSDVKYRKAHISVETTRAAIEDLGRYSSALDKAIMQYHTIKMAEVNRIASELWQTTYQGTDIDTILIRSESEGGKGTYNYRVCMVKQDTEMDMRGRCSAGQKVLASIIIRLALAESFGANCGMIALDEPTTNLDRDNIRSLAESLHRLIKQRQAQSNFQLIVITHDEEFLRHMRCSEFCDTFTRVRRNDRQCSAIAKESISTVL